jgi:hypothetical protein
MFAWLQKSVTFAGSALFRGNLPLRKENFDHLRALGIEIREHPPGENFIWSLELNHPQWGQANLFNTRNAPLPPHTLIDWDPELTPDEAQEIKSCGTAVQFVMQSNKNNILRDRKYALHYLNAILGEEGFAAMDHVAQKIWPRGALEIETAHDADLDIDGIMTYHWVTWEDRPCWLHSHGLGEIGFFDFDILNPSEDLQSNAHDVLRCIAFKSLEGELKPGSTFAPLTSQEIRAVSADDFMAKAAAEHRAVREGAELDHREARVVLCDASAGVIRSLFGNKPHPSRLLSTPYDESQLIHFSTAATELLATRAKATFDFFTRLAAELAEFESTPLVKLGYPTDNAEDESDREHMWFEFHGRSGDQLDATLLNQPFHIARMKEGQRGLHSPDLLTDWAIFTPAGKVTPAFSRPLRFIRRNADRVREAMKESKAQERESPE